MRLYALGALSLAVATLALHAVEGCGGNEFTLAQDGGAVTAPSDSGGSDAPSTPDAGASWCSQSPQSGATFCEDFDEYASGAAGISAMLSEWPDFSQQSGAFAFDTNAPPSAPNALDVTGSNGAQVLLVRGFVGGGLLTTELRLEFDLRINSAGNVGALAGAGFAAIAFGSSVGDGYAAMAIGSGPVLSAVWTLPADAGPIASTPFKSQNASGAFPTTGQWSGRYALEIDYTGVGAARSGTIQIYQGPSALLTPPLALPAQFNEPKTISIGLGDYAAGTGTTGSIDIEFDNVTFVQK